MILYPLYMSFQTAKHTPILAPSTHSVTVPYFRWRTRAHSVVADFTYLHANLVKDTLFTSSSDRIPNPPLSFP